MDNDQYELPLFFWLGQEADVEEEKFDAEEEEAYDKWVKEFVTRGRIDVV